MNKLQNFIQLLADGSSLHKSKQYRAHSVKAALTLNPEEQKWY